MTMRDEDLAAVVRQKIADDEAQLARHQKLLALLESEGPVVVPARRKPPPAAPKPADTWMA